MAATKNGKCKQCGGVILIGQMIRLWARSWAHLDCEDPWRSLRRSGRLREEAAGRATNLPRAGLVAWWSGRLPDGGRRLAPSPDEVEALYPWTKKKLADIGVPWPPPTGWKRELERIYWAQRGQSEVDGNRTVPGKPVVRTNTTPTPGGFLDSVMRSRYAGNS